MTDISKTVLVNAISLYDYLAIYGFDKYHSKEDLILLSFIDEIIRENCNHGLITECIYKKMQKLISDILDKNPSLKYCRIFEKNYKNYSDSQNIRSYQLIKNII
jgi:hypothetical protein